MRDCHCKQTNQGQELGGGYLVKLRRTGKVEIGERYQARVKQGSRGSGRGMWRPGRSRMGLIPHEQIKKHSIRFIYL
jgi:hypothetical protein